MREQLIPTDRVYVIQRRAQGVVCTVSEGAAFSKPLPLRLDLWNHAPTGFEFGYGGSGPAQLALAMLADCSGDGPALAYHQAFKWAVIARLPADGGSLTETFVRDVLAKLQSDRAAQQARNN